MGFIFFTAFIRSDKESGETSLQEAPSKVLLPSVPPKPGTLSVNLEAHTRPVTNYLQIVKPVFSRPLTYSSM